MPNALIQPTAIQPSASSSLMPYASAASLPVSHLFQGVFRRVTSVPDEVVAAQVVLSPSVHQATAKLIHVLQSLCAPDSGWPPERPQTPQTLLPYVSDEAEELLEALHDKPSSIGDGLDTQAAPSKRMPDARPELISDLGDYLVWSIAASDPDTMALLEGTSAIVQMPGQIKRIQGVRLIPALNISFANVHYALDLITRTTFNLAHALPDNSLIRLGEYGFSETLLLLSYWRETLWTQAIATVPELNQWRQRQTIKLLLPGNAWCLAQVSLDLHLVAQTLPHKSAVPIADRFDSQATLCLQPETGTPTAQVWSVADDAFSAVIFDPESKRLSHLSQPPSLDTEFSFVDEAWLYKAIAATLTTGIGIALCEQHQTNPEWHTLAIVDEVYRSINPASLHARTEFLRLQSPLTLSEFCHQLQWLWVQTHKELMPLMRGITAYRLNLGGEWQVGTLVTTSQLLFHYDSEILWHLELDTRQWHTGDRPLPDTSISPAILHLQATHLLAQSLWQMDELTAHLRHTFRQRSPILEHLMQPNPIAMTILDGTFPFTTSEIEMHMELQLVLKFYPLEEA